MPSRRGVPLMMKALLALVLPVGALGGTSAALALSGTAAATAPVVLHVATTGATTGTCTTAAHPCATLGYALSKAAAGATIELAAGSYSEAKNPTGTPNTVTKAVTVEGVATHATTAIITATGEEFGLIVQASTSVVKDLTVQDSARSGVLVSPKTTAAKPATVARVTISTNHVVTNDKCATTATYKSVKATLCKTPTPESDFGEGLHLLSVSHSTIKGNTVEKNFGGILVTDELGPNFTNLIETNTTSTNTGDCGITLAGHNATAVFTSGGTTGKPDPTAAGVYGNTVKHNTVDGNGGAGLLAATPFPGTGVYSNTYETNTVEGNGLPGMTIHSHAPLQDTTANKVMNNTFKDNGLHGGTTGGAGTGTAHVGQTDAVEIFAAVGPADVSGTVVTDNTITTEFYGVWMSPGVASVATVKTNTVTVSTGGTAVYSQPASVTVVAGQTADATAAAEFARAYPYTRGSCPSTGDAVVATTKVYQDALSSQFLAQDLTTGTLLTPTTKLSTVTAAALKDEGVSTVYIVGGPLAVTTTVAKAIEALTADKCGGKTASGKITVHRITGATQYGTAAAVAEFVGTAGSESFPGAYATTNATSGTGKYNDTAAKGSAAPTAGTYPTAILASGEEFQDAQAASVIAYHTKLPLLLTAATTLSTTAVAAIQKLGVKQVILMGGPLAVTNTVEKALVTKTAVSVLRVAGVDYTDTAHELTKFEVAGSTAGLGWTPGGRVMVARGNGFTDGLAGAVLENTHNTSTGAAKTARPLLLTEDEAAIGTYLTTFFKVTGHTGIGGTKGKTVTAITVLGGPLSVTTADIYAMETALGH